MPFFVSISHVSTLRPVVQCPHSRTSATFPLDKGKSPNRLTRDALFPGSSSRRKRKCSQGGSALYDVLESSVETLLVKCPSVQWRPDGLTIHAKKWFLGARFLGSTSHFSHYRVDLALRRPRGQVAAGYPTGFMWAERGCICYVIVYYYVLLHMHHNM